MNNGSLAMSILGCSSGLGAAFSGVLAWTFLGFPEISYCLSGHTALTLMVNKDQFGVINTCYKVATVLTLGTLLYLGVPYAVIIEVGVVQLVTIFIENEINAKINDYDCNFTYGEQHLVSEISLTEVPE